MAHEGMPTMDTPNLAPKLDPWAPVEEQRKQLEVSMDDTANEEHELLERLEACRVRLSGYRAAHEAVAVGLDNRNKVQALPMQSTPAGQLR